ncbi:MAG: hypothetical protein MJH09_05665 [Cetobacterium sp.]|nr:hypothetical protein [Cetobacterium sp.]
MNLKKKILCGTIFLGSFAFGDVLSSTAVSSAALNSKGLMYKAEEFHTMATVPGFSMGAPSGLVPGYGVMFGGISGKTNSNDTDGSLAFGTGFGDPNTFVGGAASLSIGSIDPSDGGAFNRGALNLSVGKHFKKHKSGISVGVSGLDLWHDDHADRLDPSFYGAVTKLFPNDIAPIIVSVGLGNNGYVDIKKDGDRKDKVGGFASVAAYVLPQVSLIADYTTGITSAGVGLVPFPNYPINITLGASDLGKDAPEEKVSFVGTLSGAYKF